MATTSITPSHSKIQLKFICSNCYKSIPDNFCLKCANCQKSVHKNCSKQSKSETAETFCLSCNFHSSQLNRDRKNIKSYANTSKIAVMGGNTKTENNDFFFKNLNYYTISSLNKKLKELNYSITIAHFNLRSLLKNVDKSHHYITDLIKPADIIAIQNKIKARSLPNQY